MINDKKIAIVGGGPGGLTLARLLQMNGADVKVYERDENEHVRVQGATLDLHDDSGLKALRQAGLMEAFEANYRPGADKIRITDKHATILMDESVDGPGELARPEIDRGPLRQLLLDSLQPGTVVWDSNFLSMSPAGDGWQLEFRHGKNTRADLVIGADGANSRIRPFITSVKPFFAGMTALEGLVQDSAIAAPALHRLLDGGKIFALGDEKTLIVSSKGDGSMAFYAGFNTTEDWVATSGIDFKNKSAVIAWFRKTFTGWHEQWTTLFETSNYFIPRPQYCLPPDQHWEALPNLTMLGDAAHLMPPYAGEGVNMAMLDALELSECLVSKEFANLHDAIAVYEENMRRRAGETAMTTLEQTASLHSPQGLQNMLAMFEQH